MSVTSRPARVRSAPIEAPFAPAPTTAMRGSAMAVVYTSAEHRQAVPPASGSTAWLSVQPDGGLSNGAASPALVGAPVRSASGACGPPSRQIGDHHVAEHRAVVIAEPGARQVAPEERAERVLVGDAEDAEGADHHVEVDRVDLGGERASGATALQDRRDQLDRRGVEAGEALGAAQVLGPMDVLDAHEADEVRVRLVVVEGELGEAADCGDRVEVLDVDRLLGIADRGVGTLQDLDVELLLAAEVVVDHPLRGAGGGRDLVAARARRLRLTSGSLVPSSDARDSMGRLTGDRRSRYITD